MKLNILTRSPRLKELTGLVWLAAAIGYTLALASYHPSDPSFNTATPLAPPHNMIGRWGSYTADFGYQALGLAAWILPVVMVLIGWKWLRNRDFGSPGIRFAGYALMAACAAAGASMLLPSSLSGDAFDTGGVVGHLLSTSMVHSLNTVGSLLLLSVLLILSFYMVSTFSLAHTGDALELWVNRKMAGFKRRPKQSMDIGEDLPLAGQEPLPPTEGKRSRRRGVALESPGLAADLQPEYPIDPLPIVDEAHAQDEARSFGHAEPAQYYDEPEPFDAAADTPPWEMEDIPIKPLEEAEATITPPPPEPKKAAKPYEPAVPTCYQLPATKLLNPAAEREAYDSFELKETAGRIKEKLEEFNVKGNVVQINPGPVVTTFEFKPDAGVKIAKITTLSEDLCLGLQAESILIERIPGKPTVGIEVPNTRREMISLRQIIESAEFQDAPSRLTIAMGKDISGRIRISELEKMPHLLIAGSTGSGKSVMLNTLIMSIIYKSTPDEVRMLMVDPKRVELGIYDGIPHLLTPVITEPKKAVNALRNAVLEMERRLKLLASYGVRNIDQFNKKIRQLHEKPLTLFPEQEETERPEEQPLPYILIVIDELADLMMLERAGVEESVIRLAQMARAVGIHLVLATQRPSVDVITGLIKANFPARISFRVATRVDSRTVLDVMGAEHLLGKGDMLFLPPGTSRLLRVHGAFVTETEITEVVDFWRNQATPEYDQSYLIAPPSADGEDAPEEEFDENEDPMYRDAVRVVLEMGKASTSILQRRLRLGYGRAARILDMMQRDGIIGPPDGSRPREVLKRPDWLDEVETALR